MLNDFDRLWLSLSEEPQTPKPPGPQSGPVLANCEAFQNLLALLGSLAGLPWKHGEAVCPFGPKIAERRWKACVKSCADIFLSFAVLLDPWPL